MKTTHQKRDRRGTLLDTTRHYNEALVRVFKRMMATATAEGETKLLQTLIRAVKQ